MGWILLAGALSLSQPAAAQDRTPAQRQALAELAWLLGQTHALRQACEGPGDQYWREWMSKLLEREAEDEAFDARMRERFNTGYASAQARFPRCSTESQAEAAQLAKRGRVLSRIVSGG
jgi:uncharacterized protein (TIGR02301 family)